MAEGMKVYCNAVSVLSSRELDQDLMCATCIFLINNKCCPEFNMPIM